MHLSLPWSWSLLALLLAPRTVFAYDAISRWGQAVVLIDDNLYIHGGMTDEFNAYSYTSAPTSSDIILLPLSNTFSVSTPPYELISSSDNETITVSQGPSLAWHAIGALDISTSLLFGGLPDANSLPPVVTLTDSSWLLKISNTFIPEWISQDATWAGQPMRRIHHTTVSTISGRLYIFGGERADGSDTVFSEHYVFDPKGPSFTQLPTENGPPGITGHASVILSNGTILVFGGYCTSEPGLLPFSTIWALDTSQDTLSWQLWPVSNTSLPSPRRAFAVTVLPGDRVLIHGGSDQGYQTTFDDGWILDTSQNPMTWTVVDALTQLGPRRDHFAVSYGNDVIFGFGYGSSGPASPELSVYDSATGQMTDTWSPPVPPSPGNGGGGGSDDNTSTGGGGNTGTGGGGETGGSTTATSTPGPGEGPSTSVWTPINTIPGQTHTTKTNGPTGSDGSPNPTSTSGGGDDGGGDGTPMDPENQGKNRSTTAIAVGTAFGVVGLLAVIAVVIILMRRKRRTERLFIALGGDDPDDSPSRTSPASGGLLPIAGRRSYGEKSQGPSRFRSIGRISSPVKLLAGAKMRNTPERRDMLEDEDTREFGYGGRANANDSSWSLKGILGGMKSRTPSNASSIPRYGSLTPWREKSDPFSDGASLLRDEESGYIGAASGSRPQGRRGMSYSTMSGDSYLDPFHDPNEDVAMGIYRNVGYSEHDEIPTARRPVPDLHLQTITPLSNAPHVLSPVTETSRNTLSIDESRSSNSHSDHVLSPFESISRLTSRTSYEAVRSPRTSSLVDQPSLPLRRSDSWWNRFSRTSFLDRRSSDRRSGGMPEIRDPNPPPRLVAIEESQHSGSPENDKDSPGSNRSNSVKRGQSALARMNSKLGNGPHGKSLTSLKTANSDALDKLVGMDVVQRERTGSQRTRESTGTTLSLDTNTRESWIDDEHERQTYASPTELSAPVTIPLSPSPAHIPTPLSPMSPGKVAARVQDYERQMSQEDNHPLNTKHMEERPKGRRKSHVDYGLVPRPSLFVANPDHRHSKDST